jgi:glucan biosynthesis protein C
MGRPACGHTPPSTRVTSAGNLPINDLVRRTLALAPLEAPTSQPARFVRRRLLLACGVAAPVLSLASTLLAMAAYPHFNPARQYLSELGGASAGLPIIFNIGVFIAGVMAAMAGIGFGMAIVALTRARAIGVLTVTVFLLAGFGLTQAAIYHWPDPRHLAINLALGIQLAPVLLLWGVWPRRDLRGLKLFLALVFVAMAALTVLTKHLIFPSLVNDANVGWWERAYALILVGWVGVAAFLLERCLRREMPATKTA